MGCRGCLVTILVVLGACVLLVVGCTGFLYTQAREVGREMEQVQTRLAGTEALGSFETPDRPTLSAEDLELWLRLRREAQPHAGRLADALREAARAHSDEAGFFEGLRTAFRLVKEVPMGYVETLNGVAAVLEKERLPYSRLVWIVRTAYGTLAAAARAGDERAAALFEKVRAAVRAERLADLPIRPEGDAFEVGLELFDEAHEWVGGPDPSTLERILAAADEWTASPEAILVDLVVLDAARREAESGEGEER